MDENEVENKIAARDLRRLGRVDGRGGREAETRNLTLNWLGQEEMKTIVLHKGGLNHAAYHDRVERYARNSIA